MAGPAVAEAHPLLQRVHAGVEALADQRAGDAAPRADAPAQRDRRRPGPAQHQQAQDQALRRRPLREVEEHHGMEDQRQEGQRRQPVRPAEPAVGDARDQRDQPQDEDRVEGPFAHALGRMAQPGERGLQRILDRRPRAAVRPLQPAPGDRPFRPLRPQPVHRRHDQRADAEPPVQPVDPVEPAQRPLQQARAQGEQHGEAHRPDGQHAGQLQDRRAQGEEAQVGRAEVRGQPEERQPRPETPEDAVPVPAHGSRSPRPARALRPTGAVCPRPSRAAMIEIIPRPRCRAPGTRPSPGRGA